MLNVLSGAKTGSVLRTAWSMGKTYVGFLLLSGAKSMPKAKPENFT